MQTPTYFRDQAKKLIECQYRKVFDIDRYVQHIYETDGAEMDAPDMAGRPPEEAPEGGVGGEEGEPGEGAVSKFESILDVFPKDIFEGWDVEEYTEEEIKVVHPENESIYLDIVCQDTEDEEEGDELDNQLEAFLDTEDGEEENEDEFSGIHGEFDNDEEGVEGEEDQCNYEVTLCWSKDVAVDTSDVDPEQVEETETSFKFFAKFASLEELSNVAPMITSMFVAIPIDKDSEKSEKGSEGIGGSFLREEGIDKIKIIFSDDEYKLITDYNVNMGSTELNADKVGNFDKDTVKAIIAKLNDVYEVVNTGDEQKILNGLLIKLLSAIKTYGANADGKEKKESVGGDKTESNSSYDNLIKSIESFLGEADVYGKVQNKRSYNVLKSDNGKFLLKTLENGKEVASVEYATQDEAKKAGDAWIAKKTESTNEDRKLNSYVIQVGDLSWNEQDKLWITAIQNATKYKFVDDLPEEIPDSDNVVGLELWHDGDIGDARYLAKDSDEVIAYVRNIGIQEESIDEKEDRKVIVYHDKAGGTPIGYYSATGFIAYTKDGAMRFATEPTKEQLQKAATLIGITDNNSEVEVKVEEV